jgi:diguanylate cyclase (GGDEF)-like protein/PAS domain S-box-containing protein
MTVRRKVLLFSLVMAAVLIGSMYLGSAYVLLRGFGSVEQKFVASQVDLVERTLLNERIGLQDRVVGWSAWNGMYNFALNPDSTFATSELGEEALSSLRVDFFIVLDTRGDIVLTRMLGRFSRTPRLDQQIEAYLTQNNSMLSHASAYDVHGEMTSLGGDPALIASAPIVTSGFRGPIAGSLVIGRYLDSERQNELQGIVGLEFDLRSLPGTEIARSPQNDSISPTLLVETSDRNHIKGSTKLQDGQGQDVLVLEVVAPRPIYTQALKSRTGLLAVVVMVSVLTVLLTLYLLHRTVLSRLDSLRRQVRNIAGEGNTLSRLELDGNDEFAELARDANGMLAALEKTQQELNENQQRYRLVADGVNDGIWDQNLTTGEAYYSARWQSMLGYPEEAIVGTADMARMHVHPEDRVRLRSSIVAHLKGETPYIESELRIRPLGEEFRWMLLRGSASRDTTGRATRLAGSLTDLTRRGLFDPLTGLPNRLFFYDHVEKAISQSQSEYDPRCALLFMDLNRFKMVNDSLGHHVGDLLIIEVAERLQLSTRETDTVARLGGDEFVVLLRNLESDSALERAVERISNSLTTTVVLAGHTINVTVSIGVIANLERYQTVGDAIRDADNAMYYAKARHMPFIYFNETMLEQARTRLEVEADLRRALDQEELTLVFQPIIFLREARISGIEALVRWHHPTRGAISPLEFIPIAEDAGFISSLGDWILRKACQEVVRLNRPLILGVNVSSRQFDDVLPERVASILHETSFPPQHLILEITESAVVKDPILAAGILARLRGLGVRIALDDFGTGYSSLSYLSNLPLDILKIDKAFVGRLLADSTSVSITRAVISLAQALGLSTVAEGVETADQAAMIQELGVAYGQGYYYAPPVPIEALVNLLGRTFSAHPTVRSQPPLN